MIRKRITAVLLLPVVFLTLLAAGSARADRGAESLNWPPVLVARDSGDFFLKPPEALALPEGVLIAQTPPVVDFMFFPGQGHPGRPWSVWGDGLAVGDHLYYTSIGDHLAAESPQDPRRGTAQVYEYNAQTRQLRLLVDIREFLEASGALDESHRYTPGKIHSRIDMGRDGWLYYSTHRGSLRRGTCDEYGFQGDWVFRTNPETGETAIVAAAPVEKHCIPAGMLDPERMIFYGGTAPGRDASEQGVRFFAWDVAEGKKLLEAADGFPRYAILSSSTGRVYWDGRRYDPVENTITPAPGAPPVRSATRETPQGIVYGTSGRSNIIWAFDVNSEEHVILGDGAVTPQTYVTSMVADPSGRYLYYVPGAHGRISTYGTPVVQYDVQSRRPKILAFLAHHYHQEYGYTPDGTFGLGLCAQGEKLYVSWNGTRGHGPDQSGSRYWDTCALTVIHIPASERRTDQ